MPRGFDVAECVGRGPIGAVNRIVSLIDDRRAVVVIALVVAQLVRHDRGVLRRLDRDHTEAIIPERRYAFLMKTKPRKIRNTCDTTPSLPPDEEAHQVSTVLIPKIMQVGNVAPLRIEERIAHVGKPTVRVLLVVDLLGMHQAQPRAGVALSVDLVDGADVQLDQVLDRGLTTGVPAGRGRIHHQNVEGGAAVEASDLAPGELPGLPGRQEGLVEMYLLLVHAAVADGGPIELLDPQQTRVRGGDRVDLPARQGQIGSKGVAVQDRNDLAVLDVHGAPVGHQLVGVWCLELDTVEDHPVAGVLEQVQRKRSQRPILKGELLAELPPRRHEALAQCVRRRHRGLTARRRRSFERLGRLRHLARIHLARGQRLEVGGQAAEVRPIGILHILLAGAPLAARRGSVLSTELGRLHLRLSRADDGHEARRVKTARESVVLLEVSAARHHERRVALEHRVHRSIRLLPVGDDQRGNDSRADGDCESESSKPHWSVLLLTGGRLFPPSDVSCRSSRALIRSVGGGANLGSLSRGG